MEGWLEPALRFVHYALLLGLFGWTAFRLVGLRSLDGLENVWSARALPAAAIAAPLVSASLMLVAIAAMMGQPLSALHWPTVEAMIVDTDMGTAFIARVALLIIGLSALLLRHRIGIASPIAAACFAGALLTLSWSGHAAATEGAIGTFHRLNNGLHLAAAGLWFGAIGWFVVLTGKVHRHADAVPTASLLSTMHRFAPFGVALVGTVAVTGLINAEMIFGLENSVTVLTVGYGMLLAAKIVLVGAMLAFGARNAQIGRRSLRAGDDAPTGDNAALGLVRRSLAGECALAFVVIGLVAVVGMLSPTTM